MIKWIISLVRCAGGLNTHPFKILDMLWTENFVWLVGPLDTDDD